MFYKFGSSRPFGWQIWSHHGRRGVIYGQNFNKCYDRNFFYLNKSSEFTNRWVSYSKCWGWKDQLFKFLFISLKFRWFYREKAIHDWQQKRQSMLANGSVKQYIFQWRISFQHLVLQRFWRFLQDVQLEGKIMMFIPSYKTTDLAHCWSDSRQKSFLIRAFYGSCFSRNMYYHVDYEVFFLSKGIEIRR